MQQQRDSISGAAVPADAPPALVSSPAWPPLLHPRHLPPLARLRDLLLTLLAWVVCVLVMRKPIVDLVAWLSPELGAHLRALIPAEFTVDTGPYLWIAGALVVVLVLNGIARRQYLRRVPSADQVVPPLPPQAQFDRAGVPVEQRDAWRGARRLLVRHAADGRLLDARDGVAPD